MAPMAEDNVIQFRPRPPSDTELESYRRMTRNWHPQMRQLLFPKYAEHDQPQEQPQDQNSQPEDK